jgi:hypothetical protein
VVSNPIPAFPTVTSVIADLHISQTTNWFFLEEASVRVARVFG